MERVGIGKREVHHAALAFSSVPSEVNRVRARGYHDTGTFHYAATNDRRTRTVGRTTSRRRRAVPIDRIAAAQHGASAFQIRVAQRHYASGFANPRVSSVYSAAADWTLSILALVQRLRRERYRSARHKTRGVALHQTVGALPAVFAWRLRSGALIGRRLTHRP